MNDINNYKNVNFVLRNLPSLWLLKLQYWYYDDYKFINQMTSEWIEDIQPICNYFRLAQGNEVDEYLKTG